MAVVVPSRRHHHITSPTPEISMCPPSLLSRPLRSLNVAAMCLAHVASLHHARGDPQLQSCPTSCCPMRAIMLPPRRISEKKREGQEARNLAKQARKRRDFSAEAMHKRNARARDCAMERLNNEAATAIFNQKNKGLSNGTVDLHGLYVNEALKYAKLEFQSVVLRSNKVARFIVGKGLHAKDGKAKIRPALEKLCKE
ncbi:hypothetical protein V8E52_004993 [Russula decolorans]